MNIYLLKRLLKKRVIIYSALTITVLLFGYFSYADYSFHQQKIKSSLSKVQELSRQQTLISQYKGLLEIVNQSKIKYPDIDLKEEENQISSIKNDLFQGTNLPELETLIYTISENLTLKISIKEKDEQQKGEIFGLILSGTSPIAEVSINLLQDNNIKIGTNSSNEGAYNIKSYSGKYMVEITANGYQKYTQEIEIIAQQRLENNISLQKAVVQKSTSQATNTVTVTPAQVNNGNYSKQTVATNLGNFTVHLMSFDLSQYGVRVDTAADGDCENDCPVKALNNYVSSNGGVAGIHGTYFCPTSYSSCAGKTNSFYYKLYNTRIQQRINWNNGLGDYLPFLSISKAGEAKYYSTWYEAKDLEMNAGISCRPKLVENNEIVLQASDLDSEKESTQKISHGFIGLKGQTIYAGIVLSATMFDSAAVTKALGLDHAFNIDGGGTSAMYYNGSYKVGPGRSMPNAIIFYKK